MSGFNPQICGKSTLAPEGPCGRIIMLLGNLHGPVLFLVALEENTPACIVFPAADGYHLHGLDLPFPEPG